MTLSCAIENEVPDVGTMMLYLRDPIIDTLHIPVGNWTASSFLGSLLKATDIDKWRSTNTQALFAHVQVRTKAMGRTISLPLSVRLVSRERGVDNRN